MDWEGAYKQEGTFPGPPPWNIGEPQPELAALIEDGKVQKPTYDGSAYAASILKAVIEGFPDLKSTADACAVGVGWV